MIRPILFPAIAVLALAGCGGRNDAAEDTTVASNEVTTTTDDTANAGESVGSLASADFAAAVAASDMYEIQSGQLATEKATSPQLKSMGQMLVADHQKSTSELKVAAAEARPAVAVMPALTPEHAKMLEALRSASADQFDRTFVEQQKLAHRKALDLLQRYSTDGDVEALKAFAGKGAPIVQKHLALVEAMNP